jgi:hypothetical protein
VIKRRDEDKNVLKAGSLLSVAKGAYSSYQIMGFFVVLKDFEMPVELENHLAAHPEQREETRFEPDSYLASLLRSGFLMEINYGVLHIRDEHFASWQDVEFNPANSIVD